eukprot:CAMPEP_0194265796 /NCGR_PEP_ID=MMETSP0169-20130528/913_1 /TAXON_ID=218684 /ORGANISM="Corethron pennatum, Strain L29A3" /LENGTH=568 /DNA_ID=CAMNT_0039006343 /DNA_START=473 /DNA_END=2179 /DNA_ORIENTATION=+
MFPSIAPGDVGNSGLLWLLLSYGYVMFVSSNYISEGLDLLLLVPSMAGLVGSCVLPIMTAIPDGAIMLFSGLGDLETAQETLSVGVGALAGSTIMVVTLFCSASIVEGRVDIDAATGKLDYQSTPKLTRYRSIREQLLTTGVEVQGCVTIGGYVLLLTALPYLLIQVPASYMVTRNSQQDSEELGDNEYLWSFVALLMSLTGFCCYLLYQLQSSRNGNDVAKNLRREAVTHKAVVDGMLSLSAALGQFVVESENWINRADDEDDGDEKYVHMMGHTSSSLPTEVYNKLLHILNPIFIKYDNDPKDGYLNPREMRYLFRDMHEQISDTQINTLVHQFDLNRDGRISFEEFIHAMAYFIKNSYNRDIIRSISMGSIDDNGLEITDTGSLSFDDEEIEEIPRDLADKSPAVQQAAIKFRAVTLLLLGTALILTFSNPIVAVINEIAVRVDIPPFYVSFVILPVISNAPEIISTQFYAKKKTRKSITIALSALQGSAVMNNTVCLMIFMGLVHFRGLAWNYSVETMVILGIEAVMALFTKKKIMTLADACVIALLFPLSIACIIFFASFGYS